MPSLQTRLSFTVFGPLDVLQALPGGTWVARKNLPGASIADAIDVIRTAWGSYEALPSHTTGQSKSRGQSQILTGEP